MRNTKSVQHETFRLVKGEPVKDCRIQQETNDWLFYSDAKSWKSTHDERKN
ncbi:Uncharacterized protein BM_BM544 [Brugia malayi]|uniref:Bm544 n=1 Tax=Brugia malayi TaxID=6279 RepID=A0A0J9XX25_BRUMA|nr:Uncharacterized protein BM_BM544 [Brugia malayi]CDP97525.1 Bm544 [Brugia malayi]VIO89180.1 Uncharacterized protein BM_BM544 [Brugia malayi]